MRRFASKARLAQTGPTIMSPIKNSKEALTVQTGLELNTLTQQWLFEPLGITDSSWITGREDDAGHAFSALQTTADALRRVGEALLQDQLVDSFYREAPRHTQQQYQSRLAPALVEQSGPDPHCVRGWSRSFQNRLLPHAPSDLISARGAGGNHLSISADLDLVIAQTIDPTSKRTPPNRSSKNLLDLIQRL